MCYCFSLFLDVYKYSSKYLLFAITIAIACVFCLWLYEKPRFYKLMFKKSKQSNMSPIDSTTIITATKSQNENPCVSNTMLNFKFCSESCKELGMKN